MNSAVILTILVNQITIMGVLRRMNWGKSSDDDEFTYDNLCKEINMTKHVIESVFGPVPREIK